MEKDPKVDVLARFTLDDDRRELVTRVDRNALVLAGPGAGKTHLLVAHAVWLAEQDNGRVVLLTYSRKAAAEMKRRADEALALDRRRLVVASTIHAHALDLLRTHGYRVGISGELDLLDSKDVQALSDEVARRAGLAPMEDFAVRFEKFQRLRGDFSKGPSLLALVDREMRSTARLDWDSSIRIATEILSTDPQVRDAIRHHDRHILLDEAQDCDPNQLAFIEQLVGPAPGNRHLFVVMDPDQSLYAFRQANPELVREWARAYAGEETEVTENFRCAPRIQALAKQVLGREWNGPFERGQAILESFQDYGSEAAWVADQITERLKNGQEPRRMAVLSRRRTRLVDVERLLSARVPIRADAREQWTPLEERALAAIAFIVDWREGSSSDDVGLAFLVDVIGISGDDAHALQREALSVEKHLGDLLKMEWWTQLTEWLDARRSPEEVVQRLSSIIGAQDDEMNALRVVAHQSRGLNDVMRLARSGPEPNSAASTQGTLVTTFHGAKGLEFDTVFIVGCEDGTVPNFRAHSDKELREEQRALYVAITRASREVSLTWVTSQNGYKKRACRFLPPTTSPIWG